MFSVDGVMLDLQPSLVVFRRQELVTDDHLAGILVAAKQAVHVVLELVPLLLSANHKVTTDFNSCKKVPWTFLRITFSAVQ